MSVIECYWVLVIVSECYWVLLSVSECYLVLLSVCECLCIDAFIRTPQQVKCSPVLEKMCKNLSYTISVLENLLDLIKKNSLWGTWAGASRWFPKSSKGLLAKLYHGIREHLFIELNKYPRCWFCHNNNCCTLVMFV